MDGPTACSDAGWLGQGVSLFEGIQICLRVVPSGQVSYFEGSINAEFDPVRLI